jgi:hypothetical protein
MASTAHVGKAGQLAVMAEFLLRGYNVATPEVDRGDDIFVVQDDSGELWRVQVKTAVGKPTRSGFSGQVAVKLKQLRTRRRPDLFYVLAVRCRDRWDFLVLPRKVLWREHNKHHAGTATAQDVVFTIRVGPSTALCSQRDWQAFRNNWSEWPTLP